VLINSANFVAFDDA